MKWKHALEILLLASALGMGACDRIEDDVAACAGDKCDDPVDADANTPVCDLEDALDDLLVETVVSESAGDAEQLQLRHVNRIELSYPDLWQGEEAITSGNGAHNQGLALSAEYIFTTAQDRKKDGWLFVHDRDSLSLDCASRIDPDIFGEDSTGRVHPGGGFEHEGWMYTVLSNHPDLLRFGTGVFVVAKFRQNPDNACSSDDMDCACEVEYERHEGGEVVVYPSKGYHGYMVRVEDDDGAHMIVYDINGDKPWMCKGRDGTRCQDLTAFAEFSQPDELALVLEEDTVVKPQQCFTIGRAPSRWQLCSPFPTGKMRLTLHAANPETGASLQSLEPLMFFREELTTIGFPDIGEGQFGEGVVLDAGQIFVAGDAPERANCGLLSQVRPCTSKASTQVIRIYEFEQLDGDSCE